MKPKKIRLLILLCISQLMLISCSSKEDEITVMGYIEGKYTYISANAAGNLNSLYVEKGQTIQTGQKLFDLDQQPEAYDLIIAENRVQQAIENKNILERDNSQDKRLFEQKRTLFRKKVTSKDELISSQTDYDRSLAGIKSEKENIEALQAGVDKLKWVISQKSVSSPVKGIVVDIYYSVGELVTAGIPVISLINSKEQKIIFYVPETVLSKIKINQNIEVLCDSCTNAIKGKIVYISPAAEYTPPVIYSESQRGKLVYRIEGQNLEDAPLYINPGQPVTVKIH